MEVKKLRAEAQVRCMGRLHKIAYYAGDQDLTLLSHPPADLEQLLGYLALGGACRCAQVYRDFKDRDPRRLPPVLARVMPVPPPHVGTWAERYPVRPSTDQTVRALTEAVVAKALEHCDYARATSRWGGGHHFVYVGVAWADDRYYWADVFGAARASNQPELPGNDSVTYVAVRDNWLEQVAERGLARLPLWPSGRELFVLDVLDEPHSVVLAARPAGGFSLRPWPGVVLRRENGRWLSWLPYEKANRYLDHYRT
jgi:hypothetical protein